MLCFNEEGYGTHQTTLQDGPRQGYRAKEGPKKAWEFLAESQGAAGWLSFHIVRAKTVLMSAQGNDAPTASEQTPSISHID